MPNVATPPETIIPVAERNAAAWIACRAFPPMSPSRPSCLAALVHGPANIEALRHRTGANFSQVFASLSALEGAELVRQGADGLYRLDAENLKRIADWYHGLSVAALEQQEAGR